MATPTVQALHRRDQKEIERLDRRCVEVAAALDSVESGQSEKVSLVRGGRPSVLGPGLPLSGSGRALLPCYR